MFDFSFRKKLAWKKSSASAVDGRGNQELSLSLSKRRYFVHTPELTSLSLNLNEQTLGM